MSDKKRSSGVWRGLTSVSASLLAIVFGASSIANANAAFINTRLGTSNYKAVDTGEEDTDSTYFKSEFSSLTELTDAKNALAEEIAEEVANKLHECMVKAGKFICKIVPLDAEVSRLKDGTLPTYWIH